MDELDFLSDALADVDEWDYRLAESLDEGQMGESDDLVLSEAITNCPICHWLVMGVVPPGYEVDQNVSAKSISVEVNDDHLSNKESLADDLDIDPWDDDIAPWVATGTSHDMEVDDASSPGDLPSRKSSHEELLLARMRSKIAQTGLDRASLGMTQKLLFGVGLQVNTNELHRHISYHVHTSVGPSTPLSRVDQWENWLQLSPRQKEIILTIFRSRHMTTSQIAQLFYARDKPVKKHHLDMARRDLGYLARRYYLYKITPKTRRWDPKLGRVLWLTGRGSIAPLAREIGVELRGDQYFTEPSQVRPTPLAHDLGAVQLYVKMWQDLGEKMVVFGGSNSDKINTETGEDLFKKDPTTGKIMTRPWGKISFNIHNWFGPRQLQLGYMDQYFYVRRNMVPDGFATIGWHTPQALGYLQELARDDKFEDFSSLVTGISDSDKQALSRLGKAADEGYLVSSTAYPQSVLLPFFYEYDRGTKPAREVADQLMGYAYLARSGIVKQRFTDIDHMPPVIMIFTRAGQLKAVRRRFQERLRQLNAQGIKNVFAPIYLTTEELFDTHLWSTDHAGRIFQSVWDDSPTVDLISLLFTHNAPLMQSEHLHHESDLFIDLHAGTSGQEEYRNPLLNQSNARGELESRTEN